MRENKVYRKPDFTIMWFTPSDNVASCPTDVTYNPVTVNCIITQSHEVFYSSCESNYNNMTIVTVTSNVSLSSELQAIEYLSDLADGILDGTYNGGSYVLSAGSYMVWTTTETSSGGPGGGGPGSGGSSSLTHAGLVSPDITSTVNSSL